VLPINNSPSAKEAYPVPPFATGIIPVN
jgi:hypothetical protein